MNFQQREALKYVIEGHNLLLGAAGTGKSFFVRKLVRECKHRNIKADVTATTGIASCGYEEATTIHRWSGIGDSRHSLTEIAAVVEGNIVYKDVRKRIMETDLLIIDEYSMRSARFFRMLNEVLKLKNNELYFGGIQNVLAGDFRQLPPVPNALSGEEGDSCFEASCFDTEQF